MPVHEAPPPREGPVAPLPSARITWDLNLATVVVLVGALASGMYFIATTRSAQDRARADQVRLETEIRDTRDSIGSGIADLRRQISTLPDQSARLDEMQRRMLDLDRWRAAMDARMVDMHDTLAEVNSEVNAMTRASDVHLPGAPPRRR